MFDRGVRRTAAAILVVVTLAACGGSKKQASAPAQPATTTASVSTTSTTETSSARTTKAERTSTQGGPSSSSAPLRVTAPYTCRGKPLRAIATDGPVKVEPAIVKPGQTFKVTVTDPGVKMAQVTLTGVSSRPIIANGVLRTGVTQALIRMPTYAGCGNKLLEIEGDLSAEAYVGVSG